MIGVEPRGGHFGAMAAGSPRRHGRYVGHFLIRAMRREDSNPPRLMAEMRTSAVSAVPTRALAAEDGKAPRNPRQRGMGHQAE